MPGEFAPDVELANKIAELTYSYSDRIDPENIVRNLIVGALVILEHGDVRGQEAVDFITGAAEFTIAHMQRTGHDA